MVDPAPELARPHLRLLRRDHAGLRQRSPKRLAGKPGEVRLGLGRRDVGALDLGQQALLAGLAQAPSRYNPFADESAAKKRRAEVLDNMVENGALSATQFHPEKSGDAGAQLLTNWLATLG